MQDYARGKRHADFQSILCRRYVNMLVAATTLPHRASSNFTRTTDTHYFPPLAPLSPQQCCFRLLSSLIENTSRFGRLLVDGQDAGSKASIILRRRHIVKSDVSSSQILSPSPKLSRQSASIQPFQFVQS